MTQLYAQPYDISATGFYFQSRSLNSDGEIHQGPEFRLRRSGRGIRTAIHRQREDIDAKLFEALGVNPVQRRRTIWTPATAGTTIRSAKPSSPLANAVIALI